MKRGFTFRGFNSNRQWHFARADELQGHASVRVPARQFAAVLPRLGRLHRTYAFSAEERAWETEIVLKYLGHLRSEPSSEAQTIGAHPCACARVRSAMQSYCCSGFSSVPYRDGLLESLSVNTVPSARTSLLRRPTVSRVFACHT